MKLLKSIISKLFVSLMGAWLLMACQLSARINLHASQLFTLSGKFSTYSSSSTSNTPFSCSGASAGLFQLNSSGDRVEPALATTPLAADGSYSFNIASLPVSFVNQVPQDSYLVVVTGCTSGVYMRPVTGQENQDISSGSSLLAYALDTSNKTIFTQSLKSSSQQVEALIAGLQTYGSFDSAWQALSTDSGLSGQFQNIVGVAPAVLQLASPEIKLATLPTTASELVTMSASVEAAQWASNYTFAYQWKLDGVVISQAATLLYAPTANQQGNHVLTLTVGSDDGTGAIDSSKLTKTVSGNLAISNNVLPLAPAMSVTTPVVSGSVPINTQNLTVTIVTGASESLCASFSNLLLTEDSTPPLSTTPFPISCTQSGSQPLSYTLTSASDGLKTLYLWAIDASGTVSLVPSQFSFYLDTAPPVVTIATGPSALTNATSSVFTFAGNDNGGTIDHYDCQLDGGSWTGCSSPKTESGLTEGDHTFAVRAIDTAGNVSTSASQTWHIDLTAPALTISAKPASITNQFVANFSFSATDTGGGAVAGFVCSVDSGSYSSCFSPFSTTLLAGNHSFFVRAQDTAGNLSAAQSYSWTIDTTAPTVTIVSKPPTLTNSQSGTFGFTGADGGGGSVASFECSLDGAGFTGCSSPQNFTSLAAGAHSFQVRAIDSASNTGSAVSYSWTIDLTTPMASITSKPDDLTNSASASFGFSATAPPAGSIVGYQCQIDGGAFATCTSPKSYTGLTQGSHTFGVRSIDNNSNFSAVSSFTWVIDLTAPVLTVSSQPASPTSNTLASFSFSATDTGGGAVATYQCNLDNAGYGACTSPKTFSGLADGSHTLLIEVSDTAGNMSAVQTLTWVVDTTAPALSLTSKPASITNSTTANFIFSATDSSSISAYQCSLDSAAASGCTSPLNLTSLAAGAHSFTVQATDAAGNQSAVVSYAWTIDITPPVVTIASGPAALTNATSATFTFNASDSGGGSVASYSCQLDSGGFSACTSPQIYSSLSSTAHTFSVKAVDTAGNVSTTTSAGWTIDTTPPVLTITTPSTNGTIVSASSVTAFSVSGTCTENGTAVTVSGAISASATCSSNAWTAILNLTSISDGTLSITAAQTDVAGNTGTSSARTFVKDTTAPTIAIGATSALQGGSTTSLNWTMTEANVAASTSFTVEIYNGSTWTSVGSVPATAGANNTKAYSLTGITVPTVDTSVAKWRVTLTDASGNTTAQQSSVFIIDSTPPTISSFQIAGGSATVAIPTVSFAISASDSATAVAQIRLSETATNPTEAWQTYVTNGSYTMSQISGNKTVYVWVRDAAGNVSASMSASTTLDFGTPPLVTVTSPTSGQSFSVGSAVPISWTCSGSNGLDSTAPISAIQYTDDDAATFCPVTTNISNANGSYNSWSIPTTDCNGNSTTNKVFKVSVACKSAAGVVANSYSQVFNTSGWSVYAGNPWYTLQNVNASIAQVSPSSSSTSSIVGDPSGNIYYVYGSAIMKIDAATGQVTRFAGSLTANGCTLGGGASLLTGTMTSPYILGMNQDQTSMLVYNSTGSCGYSILSIDTVAGTAINWSSTGAAATEWAMAKNRTFVFSTGNSQAGKIYTLDLKTANQTPIWVAGNGTCGTLPSVGTAATSVTTPCGSDVGGDAVLVMTNADASSIWVDVYDGGPGFRFDQSSSGGPYTLGSTNVGWTKTNLTHCTATDFDNYIYCTNWASATRAMNAFDPSAGTWTTPFSIPFVNNDDSGVLAIGTTPSKLLAWYSLNGIDIVTPSPGASWSAVNVAGQSLTTMGNGGPLTGVAFSQPTDIKYNAATQILWIRNASGHLRKIDFSNGSMISTVLLSGYGDLSSTYVPTVLDYLGAHMAFLGVFQGWSEIQTAVLGGTTLTRTAAQDFVSPNPRSATVPPAYPVPSGTNAHIDAGVIKTTNYNAQYQNMAYHSNGKLYMGARNGNSDVFIFSSDKNIISQVAGKSGTGGYLSSDNGTAAVGASLTNVQDLFEITTGTYKNDLLVVDGNWLRRISVTTESTPKIYDVLNLALVSGYTAGTTFFDFVYDSSSETAGLGTGNIYYVNNSNIVHKIAYDSSINGLKDTAYTINGTTFTGTARITLTPAGLLVLQPNLARILRLSP